MECKAMGTVPAEQLKDLQERLVGLSGLAGEAVHLHELVLRGSDPDKAELHLQHSMPTGGSGSGESRWSATQYRLPLEGRASADLPATVRSVVRSQCRGPDVLAFWRALGFGVLYQLLKQGVAYEVEHAGHAVQVTVCRVLRLPPGGQVPAGGSPVGEELVPGHWLVEATAAVEGGVYMEAAAALGSLSKLLAQLTTLQPLPKGRARAAG